MDIFSKGLIHGFGPKMAIFPTFFLGQYRPGKCVLRYSRTKKTLFQTIKTRSSKSRKFDFFARGLSHGFGPKMAIFPTFIFQEIQATKMFFTIFQSEKTLFQTMKTRSSKSRKFAFFAKGLSHGFGLKMAIFPTFILANIGHKNVFYDILERKSAFLAYKIKKLKKPKN